MSNLLEIDDIAEVVADAIREATAPLLERIAELEALPARVAQLEDLATKP